MYVVACCSKGITREGNKIKEIHNNCLAEVSIVQNKPIQQVEYTSPVTRAAKQNIPYKGWVRYRQKYTDPSREEFNYG